MFSDMIARLRKEKGLNQKEFAKKLGVSVDSVRRWEQGKRSPDVEKLSDIAKVLGTTVSYILGETENPERENSERTFSQTIKNTIDNDMSFI
ncbi:MAG: helix-turn-helix transcriptional regulator, partial [Synergistaceae bacterium]|nr:helix-turn-helix transcriptional regulator [Synergistaceae bacterium]